MRVLGHLRPDLALVAVVVVAFAAPLSTAPADPPRILIIQPETTALPATVLIDRGIRAALRGLSVEPRIYVEYLDSRRFPGLSRERRAVGRHRPHRCISARGIRREGEDARLVEASALPAAGLRRSRDEVGLPRDTLRSAAIAARRCDAAARRRAAICRFAGARRGGAEGPETEGGDDRRGKAG